MPMLYGEGPKAFTRLQEEIMKTSSDHSIFAWDYTGQDSIGSLLAHSPTNFARAHDVVQLGRPNAFEMTNRGLRIELPILKTAGLNDYAYLAILNCRHKGDLSSSLALRINAYKRKHAYDDQLGQEYYVTRSEAPKVPNVPASRLAVVELHLRAPRTRLEITRNFEQESVGTKFWLQLAKDDASGATLTEAYASHGSWDMKSGILDVSDVSDAPWVRASVLLQTHSGKVFCLSLGYDRLDRSKGRGFLPGVWAQVHQSRELPREVCETIVSGRCSHEEGPYLHGSCPHMPRIAKAGTLEDIEVLTAEIHQRDIIGDRVFVVLVSIVAQNRSHNKWTSFKTSDAISKHTLKAVFGFSRPKDSNESSDRR